MKQGNNSIMRVNIDYDFDKIENIVFIFKQEDAKLRFTYPSDKAVKVANAKAVNIIWSSDETYLFDATKAIFMDTKIYLKDADTNPETGISKFYMSPTLFEKGD